MNTHRHPHFEVLTQTQEGYIGACRCCRQYNFVFRNLLLVFSEQELINFLDWLLEFRHSPHNRVELFNNRNRLYTSPHSNLFIAFNEEELDEIAVLSAEVRLMMSVQSIFQNKS